MSRSTRPPAVAGRFYPACAATLWSTVDDLLDRARDLHARPALGCMAPHAGYVYSGTLAARAFAAVDVPARVIVLCPNHTGRGARVSVSPDGAFAIPGASVPVDADLAAAVLAELPGAAADREAHLHEHAIEVELPLLRARRPDVRVVPVVLAGLDEAAALALGPALARAVDRVGTPADVLVVASSDMSHFLPDAQTRAVDRRALAPLLAFDPAGLYRTVTEGGISMCGVIPATAMLAYAREHGAASPELLGYATSGDVSGDRHRVVGYASVVVPA